MQLSASPSGDTAIPVTAKVWQKIEARFRLWSFHIYYDRSYATEIDPTLRFVKALIASTQPIRDRNAVLQWHRERARTRKTTGERVRHGDA
jgi:hypothetical protein